MSTESAAKKDIQKLQRAIVDGLEEVKAQDIQVFDTEHLSPLFERVIVASGSSNRQTKALAASVRDAVRDAGFNKPRTEGEDNGEWIIVDCGPAVAHIMQPTFRLYYRLEDLWGDKPVRLKFGAPKPAETVRPAVKKTVAKKTTARTTTSRNAAAKAPAAKRASSGAGKTGTNKTAAKKTVAKKTVAKKTAARKPTARNPAARNVTARAALGHKSSAAKPAPRRS